MPRVYLHQADEYRDITDLIVAITWSGSKTEGARKLQINLVNTGIDKSIPNLYINNGSILKLFQDDGVELFKGFVFFNEKSSQASSISVIAYDHLIYCLKNKGVYNFKEKTPEEITSIVCNDFGIPKGNIIKAGIKQSFIANGKYIYDIIMQAYTGASKQNSKKYMPRIKSGRLDVIEIGSVMSTFMLSDESNIIDSGYSESIENMVNRIRIYDENGKSIGVVDNAEWIKKYGLIQNIYTKEKDKQAQTVAKLMLKDAEKNISIEALGHVECVTGNGVQVKDTTTGLIGVFYIDSDTHVWKNGQHIMRLKLNFKNIMNEKEG